MILKYEAINITINSSGGRISDAEGNVITFNKEFVLDEVIIPRSGVYKYNEAHNTFDNETESI